MNSAVEDVKSRINIVDIIGEYIKLQKAGASWKALCPFHREKTPSFIVTEEKQIWHCFGCGKGGDVFSFVMEMEGLEFKDALKMLAERSGVDLAAYRLSLPSDAGEKENKAKTFEILKLASRFYEKQLWDGIGKEKILPYLRKRGINDESAKKFQLGYAPEGWRNILEFLTKRGYAPEEIIRTGLLVEKNGTGDDRAQKGGNQKNISSYYDRFRDRIIFPVSDAMGNIAGFSARVAPGGDESQAKYVNTPETLVYRKSKILYGLNHARREIKDKGAVLVVEGNTDVIAAHQAGIVNAVAVSGTALTGEQLDILKRYSDNLYLLFDMDEAGTNAIRRSAESAFEKDFNVFVVRIPEGKDAAELAQKDAGKLVAAVKAAVPAMDYFFQRLFSVYDKNNARDKKNIAREALNLTLHFKNEIEKSHWVKKLSHEIDVSENLLNDALRKARFRTRNEPEKSVLTESCEWKTRYQMIQEKIFGLMLADPLAWKKTLMKHSREDFWEENGKFAPAFVHGPEIDFRFELLLNRLENDGQKDYFQKMYFNALHEKEGSDGFRVRQPEEILDLLEKYIFELKKEWKRNRRDLIVKDIKKAESEGDRESRRLLFEELSKISKDVE